MEIEEPKSINEIQKIIDENKNIESYDDETIKYLRKPIGKTIYKSAAKNPEWSDKIKCSICGRKFLRSNKWAHNQSQFHKSHLTIHEKIRKLILD